MECPSCRHVPKEEAPKFCSECGQRLLPAVPAPESENNPTVASVPEEEMESGQELKEEGGPFPSLGSSDQQESLQEPCSLGSRTSKRRRRKRRQNKSASASTGPESLSSPASMPCGLQFLASPEVPDAALPASPAQAATGGESAGSEAPQDQTRGDALPEGKGQEGPSPTPAASVDGPGKKAAARELPLPEPDGAHSEPRKELRAAGQRPAAPASGAIEAPAEPATPGKGAEKKVQNKTQESKQPRASDPASREHRQESETTGKTAVSGEEAKPQALKKPGEAPGPDVAAMKEKAQKAQKAAVQEVPRSALSPVEGVTVFFHAIISKDFGFQPDQHKVFVRGGAQLGEPEWNRNVCEMHCTKDMHPHGYLVEGSTVISKQHLDKPIPYKYVVSHGQKQVEFEFIYENQKGNVHINRCLHVKSELLGAGDWHQYDDIACMKPPGKVQAFMNKLWDQTRKKLVKGKKIAAGIMADSLFSVLQSWSAINLKGFMTQFHQFYSVIRAPMIYETGPRPWSSLQYEEKQVKEDLWEHLKHKMAPLLAEKPLPEDFPVKSRLRMGLVVLRLVHELKLPVSAPDLSSLCDLLCWNGQSLEEFHAELSLMSEAPQRWREALMDLCRKSMAQQVDLWVGVLPVLHHFMERPPPAGGAGMQQEDTWAALRGLPFKEFREKRANPNQLLQLMGEKKPLLAVDTCLFRSWFSLLPLHSLVAYLKEFTDCFSCFRARVLDCLLGTFHRLQELKEISDGNLKDVQGILDMLLHLLDKFKDKILEENSIQTCWTVCLELHETVCRLTKGPVFHELPALSAEIVCAITTVKPPADSEAGPGKEARESSAKTFVQGILATTRSWLQGIFKKSMFQSSHHSFVTTGTFTYYQEIQVWRRLVGIDLPAESGWKESLLRDMEGRIRQGSPRAQILAFCSSRWEATGDSVYKCFENCAIEAVSAACQSQTSVLEGLSCSDLEQFGTLVSAVITKSWPKNSRGPVNDLPEVLKHLLTGPDIKHLFRLYGTNEQLLEHITKEGRQRMETADSVLMEVANDLLSGAVLVGQLDLIWNHKTQFLDIWELKRESLSPQEKKQDMQQVLCCRWKELTFLQEERRHVDSLLKLCEGTKHLLKVDFGEIAQRHLEDLSGKSLNDAVTVNASPTSSDLHMVTHYRLSPHIQEMAQKIDMLKDSHIFRTFWEEVAKALRSMLEEEKMEEAAVDVEVTYKYLYLPCLTKFRNLYKDLKSGDVTLAKVDTIFKVFVNQYDSLTTDLNAMCALDPGDPNDWVPERVEQISEYHRLQRAADVARVIQDAKEALGLTGDFNILHILLRLMDRVEDLHHGTLGQIDKQVVSASRALQDINELLLEALRELALRKQFISWVQGALRGIHELKVFVDLASISAGENDIDVDRVACFHDAVQGYRCLLYELDVSAGFCEFMDHLKELWKALQSDQYLPKKLRDSARNLEWLKTVKESHGSVELSSLSLATAINSRGIYVVQAPADGQRLSPDTVLGLTLPGSHGDIEEERDYSLEELKELLNKLMLMSGRKDQKNVEVEVFSEVFSSVERLMRSFISLYSAGNLLFRDWKAKVRCSPEADASVLVDFGPGPLQVLEGRGPLGPLLEAVCRQMELFLGQWEAFVAQKRAEHFYLNYYTAEQLVYLSTRVLRYPAEDAALTMLSFLKPDCSAQDVWEACRRPDGAAARHRPQTEMERLLSVLRGPSGLADKLRAIMEQSLTGMCDFLPHCLDLEGLGRCLAHLATKGRPPVVRELPRGLQAGQPNLIVCGPAEVLLAALAIYMRSQLQPLPTYDEVLLCTPETTFEEVALLLRRCLSAGARGRGVYSLLHADQLSYEVACQVEALFQSLCTRPHREDYQLVLVCGSEREHCYLPSAFSQHKVPITPQASLEAMQAYLAHHFRVPERTPSAAAVFRDRMCVGIVASERAGVGKSLYVKSLHQTLQMKFSRQNGPLQVIRLIDPRVDEQQVLGSLLPFLSAQCQARPMIFHFDVTSSVQTGIWAFLFKLLILQHLMDINGKMWLRNPCHLYVIEILEGQSALPQRPSRRRMQNPQFSFLDIFPKVTCRPPKEVIDMELRPQWHCGEPGMDQAKFCSETFQRPFQYLKRFHQKQDLDAFQFREGWVEGTPKECIQHFLIYCGVADPSWSELWNFARFLNYQLKDCEASLFCNPKIVGDTLRGFKNFVVTFMILMARDFATPTLHMSDQSPGKHMVPMDGVEEEDIAPFSLRKRWESEPHPYVFFNDDHTSMTFIGFHLQPNSKNMVDAIDPLSKKVIKKDVMTTDLYQGLLLQRVPFNVDFDGLPRHEKLQRLCLALGIQWPVDPDETYELTTDNMLKILAIEMRFRCGIPVIIMGETGCGKTRLIKFLSGLRRGCTQADTMRLVKVHGGTTADMIYARVQEAERLALTNKRKHQLDTVLFFDEANTTEAVSCIKEVLCDRTVGGLRLVEDSGLHIIAACNPYRKHSPEMIARLEAAGLGYRVRAEETADRLGSTPLRQLVYRVHALPPSLTPLVWDFGQLNDTTERLYIRQIVQRLVDTTAVGDDDVRVITDVLSASQRFMRKRGDECGFVSLRDVERCAKVFRWFHERSAMLLSWQRAVCHKPDASGDSSFEDVEDPVLWALVLAVGVCYHASLEKQESYREAICQFLPRPYNDGKAVLATITRAQDLFLDGVSLRKTIARNTALKENVFMMVVCIELRIPLFLVGKPGSSKSLAKTIVADAMQGQAAHSDLFRNLKQVHLVSFQCSPHSTPQGIISTFKQCARFQQDKDLQQYVSVVVLDEVGLAEDSPKMPLKALHPLLEDGCIEDDPAPHKKVGFIGISNWALDPAKMNRGIFVSRGSPNKEELVESAKGICSSEPLVQERIKGYFAPFAKAYETVCENQDKEFFGLRDYYSLIKMVFASAKASNKKPSPQDIARAVLRNFSGKDGIHALDIFAASLPEARLSEGVSTMQLIEQNVYGDPARAPGGVLEDSASRYLLLLTRNYVALQILQQTLFSEDQQPEIIFGSSFPRDQEYTQICRNINRVKICMETGKMVVLLNLQNLYESLYDALNQYYVHLGGQKYVDLGLGTHRVKCRVHPDFHLIVIEEKDVVYNHFPIPLINRLEKHYLDINTVLEKWQKKIVEELKGWVDKFVNVTATSLGVAHRYSPSDVFIGYHSDTCASVVLQVIERLGHRAATPEHYQEVLEGAKRVLLDCATPDAVVRLCMSPLGLFDACSLSQEYYYRQQHDSFADFLQAHLRAAEPERRAVFTEITTFSRLLTGHDCKVLELEVTGRALRPTILSLQQFDTEHSFLREVGNCLDRTAPRKILVIQTDFEDGTCSAQLIASAKYSAINEINKRQEHQHCIFVYFITKLSRMESGSSYVGSHGGLWRSVHIDDLRRSTVMSSDVTKLQDMTISQLFDPDSEPESTVGHGAGDSREEEMEVEADEPGAAQADMETNRPEARGTPALDTGHLLRSCIQGAVGLLQDPSECGQRHVRRVELLLSLLSEDDAHTAAFFRVAKRHLHGLLQRQEESFGFDRKQWVVKEASNPNALQEAGTFRHTLWKRIQGAVTPLLASMVSVIDRNGNLELLAAPDTPSWTRDLWMFIFSDLKLLNIPLVANAPSRFRSEATHIPVPSHMQLSQDDHSSFPFSWRIRDYVDELGAQAQYISEPTGASKKLLEIFQQTPLGLFLARLPGEERQELLHCYLRDFLLLTMKVSSGEELMFLQMALWSCIQQLSLESHPEELSLPWVHLAYQHFRTRLQNFSRILTIHPLIVDSLKAATRSRNLAGREMTLDVSAALACAELLLRDLLKPSPQAWLQTVKRLSMPLELLCSDGYLQSHRGMAGSLVREVRTHWNRIFSVALFVEHVLLGTESHLPELRELVAESACILDKRLQGNSDIKTFQPFRAVMKTLCECKEQAKDAFMRSRVPSCSACLADARDPVCLPCEHVFCLRCVRAWLTLGQMDCQQCLAELPEDFSPEVSQEMRAAIEKHAHFRRLCTGFFVDLVSTMCFKDNCPPDKDVVDLLLSLLFVEKKHLRGAPQRLREHTKCLSPFDDVVDKTPVIRSVVLKLLLKYSFHEVKGYIQDYLTQLEKKAFLGEDKTELYLLFSSCLEDSIREKRSTVSGSDDLRCLREDVQFFWERLQGPQERTPEASVEGLQEVARLRLCLDKAADILAELRAGLAVAEEAKQYLWQVKHFCAQAGNDWYRVYLVRKLTSLLGMESVQHLSRPGHPAQWVFPKEVIAQQRDHLGHMDRFLVHGQEYKAVRDAVGKVMLECRPQAVKTALQACRSSETHQAAYLLLALFREVTTLYRSRSASLHPTPEQREAVSKLIEESPTLSQDMRDFAISLVTHALPLLRAGPGGGSLEGAVIEMAVHAAVILFCGQHRVLEPLRNLAFAPATMTRAFLPTMPEDLLAQARSWKGLEVVQWYTCPNGHPCAVGECGRPMEQSFCIDCRLPVGGTNHRPQAGFTTLQHTTDRTQTGHVLGIPPRRDEAVVSDRDLSPVVFLLARLLTHLALLLGAAHSPQAMSAIIHPPVEDPREFLEQHIHRDVEQLMKTLGRSADDTASVIHLVLHSLLTEQRHRPAQEPFHFDATLSTKEQRNSWEKCVETLISPELKRLDKALLTVNALISHDERISSNPVAKLVFHDPVAFLPHLPRNSVVHSSKMWSCRTRVTVEYLQHIVEQKNGKETVPVLWKFLQKEGELRLVRFLPEILALQRDLVKWFQNASEAEYPSIHDFIYSHSSDGLKQLLHNRFMLFLSTWNRLRRSLETNGEIKLPKDYCSTDLSLDAKLEVVLPRRQGLGLCSTALVSYLITLHNEMVYTVEKLSEEENNYSVDASEVTDLHVINYEVERHLTPLILSNCQYQVEQGGESLQEFDLEKIQRQLTSRFLQGKPRLTLRGLPTLVRRHDRNYELLFASIRNNVPQVPLPNSALNAISGQLQSHSDACEALSVIEVTLGFLSTAGEDPNMDLNVYIQDKLRMSDQTEEVLKALHRCQLRHVIALWQLLSAHKSEQQLRLRKEPFGEISARYGVELSPECAKLLSTFLNQGGLDTFLLELHEMMVLKLKNPQTKQDFNPNWSLKETLVTYMEAKDSDILPEMEAQFPEEILLSNCVSVWKMAVELKRGRQLR